MMSKDYDIEGKKRGSRFLRIVKRLITIAIIIGILWFVMFFFVCPMLPKP